MRFPRSKGAAPHSAEPSIRKELSYILIRPPEFFTTKLNPKKIWSNHKGRFLGVLQLDSCSLIGIEHFLTLCPLNLCVRYVDVIMHYASFQFICPNLSSVSGCLRSVSLRSIFRRVSSIHVSATRAFLSSRICQGEFETLSVGFQLWSIS